MSSQTDSHRTLRYSEALCEAFRQEMELDPSVVLFGIDVEDHKAIQGSTRGLLEKFGSDRVFSTPLSEDAMTGIAIGAAMAGMRPIHVHIRMDFLMLAMNQLINIASKAHFMYNGEVSVPLVVRSMIGKSWGQGAQHSQGLYSMFMHVPGLKVVVPSNAYDAKGCMISSIRDPNPVIFVEHRLLYETTAPVPVDAYTVDMGKARVARQGTDITIVGISNMFMECLRAAEILADEGIEAEVIDPISLVPLDIETIFKSVAKTGHLLVVDNAWTNCGASAEILAQISEMSNGTVAKLKRIGYAPTTCPTTPALEEVFYPNPGTIAQTAYRILRKQNTEWEPDPRRTKLTYQTEFRGPF